MKNYIIPGRDDAFARPAWLNVSLPHRLHTTSGGPTRQLCFPAPSPSFVCSSDSFSTFVALPLDVKTNTGTRVGKETGGTRGKSSFGPPASKRAPAAWAPAPRAGSREPGRAGERGAAGGRASARGRVQSAFCECAAALGEKRIIVAPARPAPSRRAGPERLRQVVHSPPYPG